MKREAAWRVFAGEYNDSTVEIKSEGEMMPSYVVTPLGAKINRVFIIGVLTDVENVSEGGDFVRAHISDPTGVFTLYSGSYQKEITDIISEIDVPAFVAVTGKVRTYIPEEGTLYVSIRPERIMEVDSEIRDSWIIDTCKNTKLRIEAILEAMKMSESSEFELRKLCYSKDLSEGAITALKNYENIDLNKYVALIREALQFLVPGEKSTKKPNPDVKKDKKIEKEKEVETAEKTEPESKKQEKTVAKEKTKDSKDKKDFDEIERNVQETIKKIEGEKGASWDKIIEECKKVKIDKDTVEEALTSLMDKGLIYEPILGTIKTT